MKKVTIQGVSGCYHDAAARYFFKDEEVETIPCDTFHSLFETLKTDASLFGIIAIENSRSGSLFKNLELLRLINQHRYY